MELQTINQVSKAYDISTRMLRYYEEIGLIKSLRKEDYAYRVYDQAALLRLRQIVVLRKLRVPVRHIRAILSNAEAAEIMNMFMQNIRELDGEIASLSTIRDILVQIFNKLGQAVGSAGQGHEKILSDATAQPGNSGIPVNFDLLLDSSVLSIVETLSLSKNLVKETSTVEEVAKKEAKTVTFGEYLWRVLEEKDGYALIITEHTIEERSYHSDCMDITWEHCDMRQYLNGPLFESFTPEEQARIQVTKLSDRNNPWTGTKCGNPTVDKIFLLSYDEVLKYFGDSGDVENRVGWHWIDIDVPGFNSGVPEKGGTDFINDQYNSARRVTKPDGSAAWWWLRSPGGQGQWTTGSIGFIGELFLCGDDVWMHSREYGDDQNAGVRPAMWVKI